ncbi:MAG TPA: prepilin-type N-terminal cleavage/methylation domain-containing protein [Thermoanaerobaculia bacterium]|nr:prepilin-type N-terminal cleavage/methylation domain-containing protein [Thermoanaerobaculia bacterium]
MRSRRSGFTLLEVLVVVAIIGLLSAIAIMRYQTALLRARQKRTMADMRAIALAWEARAIDVKRYNAAGFTVPAYPATSKDIGALLSPTYIRIMPERDGWEFPFAFNTDEKIGDPAAADQYCIRSAGRDHQFSASYTPGPTDDPDGDIVYSGGTFIVYPAAPH